MSSSFARYLDDRVYKRAGGRDDLAQDGLFLPFDRQGSVSGLSSASLTNYNLVNESGPKTLMWAPREPEEVALILSRLKVVFDAGSGAWADSLFMTGMALTSGLRLVYHDGVNFIQDFWRLDNLSTTVPWPKTNRHLIVRADAYSFEQNVGLSASGILKIDVDLRARGVPLYLPVGHSMRLILASDDTIAANHAIYMFGQGFKQVI